MQIALTLFSTLVSFSLFSTNVLAFEVVPGEYIAKLKPGFEASLSLAGMKGMSASKSLGNGLVLFKGVQNPLSLKGLKGESIYEYIEPNYIYHAFLGAPDDERFDELWGLSNTGAIALSKAGNDINVLKAWDITQGKKDIIVAVIDTGVELSHPDLKDQIYVNLKEKKGKPGVDDDNNGFIDDVNGYDFANNDNDPSDDVGHGTHCSGTIGATHNTIGIAGVMANVRILPIKFIGLNGGTSAAAIKAIQYAIKMKVNVMSNSWGGGAASKALEDAIKAANKAGIVFVAAAGNDANNNDKMPSYPASYKVDNVISVAALSANGKMASFSNYGASSVHVMAPGDKILSTYPGKTYKSLSGTSMATPHVSGVVGLMLSQEKISPKVVRDRLIASSVKSSLIASQTVSQGRVDAFRALTQN
ncbi:MAG: S8 family peptidase [Bacteriovoracaceae bacterium]